MFPADPTLHHLLEATPLTWRCHTGSIITGIVGFFSVVTIGCATPCRSMSGLLYEVRLRETGHLISAEARCVVDDEALGVRYDLRYTYEATA